MFYGILIIIERLGFSRVLEKLPPVISRAYTFFMVVTGWVMFDIDTMPDVLRYLKAMFAGNGLADSLALYQLSSYGIIFVLCIFASTDIWSRIAGVLSVSVRTRKIYAYTAPVVMLSLLIVIHFSLITSMFSDC